jgi:hypothetical protein
MRYKPKSTAALHIALGGLPDKMRVELVLVWECLQKPWAIFGR